MSVILKIVFVPLGSNSSPWKLYSFAKRCNAQNVRDGCVIDVA